MSLSEKIAVCAASASTIIGIIALIVSSRATKLSRKAHELARDAYLGERRILLKSERSPQGLLLSASGADQSINNMTIYFPSKLGIPRTALAGSNLTLRDGTLQHRIKVYWDSMTPAPEPGFAAVRQNAAIPVVVVVHGYTKGVASITTGFYDLYTLYVLNDKGESAITISNLAFNNYDVSGGEPQEIVDGLLEAVEALIPVARPSRRGTGEADTRGPTPPNPDRLA